MISIGVWTWGFKNAQFFDGHFTGFNQNQSCLGKSDWRPVWYNICSPVIRNMAMRNPLCNYIRSSNALWMTVMLNCHVWLLESRFPLGFMWSPQKKPLTDWREVLRRNVAVVLVTELSDARWHSQKILIHQRQW